MFDVNDDAKGAYRRVEVLTGPGRRRRWSDDQKARIIAETLEPGARVAEVARRWQICSQQLFSWRCAARRSLTVQPLGTTAPMSPAFVPIITEPLPTATIAPAAAPMIEIRLAGAVVRVVSGMDDAAQLTAVLRAVRASASRT